MLVSVIRPKNNILTLVTPHFADRLSQEKFIIYDESRKLATFHLPGKPWILVKVPKPEQGKLEDISVKEDEYRNLWKTFFDHIATKERFNPKLQRNNLPLRFRSNMTEFKI